MSIAYFNGDQISNDSFVTFSATGRVIVETYPRTIGGVLKESGIVDRNLTLHSYLVLPDSATRLDLENFFNSLNEQIGPGSGTLQVNGNTYNNLVVNSINYDTFKTKKFIRYTVGFKFEDQTDDGVIRQLNVPNLQDFSRGRKLRFDSYEDGKSFHFWHNFDNIRTLETSVRQKNPGVDENSRVTKTGGFEKITCYGWILGPEQNTRQNFEAYFYNIINGPLGKLGTLYHDGEKIAEYAMFTEFSMDDSLGTGINYVLSFLTSLQC